MQRKHRWWCGLVVLSLLVSGAQAEVRSLPDLKAGNAMGNVSGKDAAAPEADASSAPAARSPSDVKIPAGWLRGVGPSGYEKALELQKATGKDMLLYFFREDPRDEKGLCHWFEKKTMNEAHVLGEMRNFIKVRIDAAQHDSQTRALVEEYHCGKTPRLVVRQADGHTKRIDVFHWPQGGGQPTPVPPGEVVKSLQEASSPASQGKH